MLAILTWAFVSVLILMMLALTAVLVGLTWAIVDGVRANNKEGK